MDLLAQRYASPFLILDEFIRLQQLHDFAMKTLKTIADEKVHEARWQYYLHKVWKDVSFQEYVEMCENQPQKQEMSQNQIGSVINDSRKMLEGFMPE